MAHKWTYPSERAEYMEILNPETRKYPEFRVVCEIECRGSYQGAGHAWVVEDVANGLTCLQSYSTIVSVVLGGRVERLGKWSRITTGHQNRFELWAMQNRR